MPIEGRGYRAWSGDVRRMAHRVYAISLSEFQHRIKRPWTIAILVLIGLYSIFTGIMPIMGNITEGDGIFIEDPNIPFNKDMIPEISIVGVDILDSSGSSVQHYEPSLEIFDLPLKPGNSAVYEIEMKNQGSKKGSFQVMIELGSGTENWRVQWIEDDSQIADKNGEERYISYYDSMELDLKARSSRSIWIKVALEKENVSFDSLAVYIAMESGGAYGQKVYIGEEDEDIYLRTSLRFDLYTEMEWPDLALKQYFEIELITVKDPAGIWSQSKMDKIYESPPRVIWWDDLIFMYRFTNSGTETLYLKIGVAEESLEGPIPWPFSGWRTNNILSLEPGKSIEHSIIISPFYGQLPVRNQMQVLIVASDNAEDFDSDFTGSDYYDESEQDAERTMSGRNMSFTSVPFVVKEKREPVIDLSGEYFFNVFYTGGINIWVILLAIIVGSGLIADDRANKVIPLYFSKAITKKGYIIGKFCGLGILIGLVTVIWSNLWFLTIMILGGFSWEYFTSHLWIMGAFTIYGLLVTFVITSLTLAASSLARNRYVVGASILATFLITTFISVIISKVTGEDNYLMISPSANFLFVGHALFDLQTSPVEWEYALLSLAGLAAISWFILWLQLIKREVANE